ncbi:lipopolysaccharide assembly protein LapA domain-containing protein [Uniformispora flossi]|uniref:lipopolysaccharide assembly protein LapA domain-containing protein n=1 Tax=Uniformispora flossi TaxID=3390723 RepID=UPI003C30C05A
MSAQPARPAQPVEHKRRGVTAKLVVAVLLTAVALIFIFQNTGSQEVHFLGWYFSMATWLWILVIFLLGAVVGSIFPWLRSRRR